MARQTVTTHKRTMRNGTTVTVHQHKRRGVSLERSWRSVRRGWKHQRRGNPGRAAAWIGVGVLEAVTYATFQVAGVFFVTLALFSAGMAVTLKKASGKEQP